ncbi:MAG: hypothetical protein ACT4ON_11110 [Bacteroidota bacterium]
MAQYFTSFYPLCCSAAGKEAVTNNSRLLPFIDGSCRREPDFQNEYPAITGLCRPGFSKKLQKGDIVVYTTNKKFLGVKKLVAILEVIEKTEKSHSTAAEWYQRSGKIVPNNIIVDGTKPFELNQTHQLGRWDSCGDGEEELKIEEWDALYKERAKCYPEVAICKIWNGVIDLTNPRTISDEDLLFVFNRMPGTQTPPAYKEGEWERFLKILRINEKAIES